MIFATEEKVTGQGHVQRRRPDLHTRPARAIESVKDHVARVARHSLLRS